MEGYSVEQRVQIMYILKPSALIERSYKILSSIIIIIISNLLVINCKIKLCQTKTAVKAMPYRTTPSRISVTDMPINNFINVN